MGTIAICAPREKLREGSGNSFQSKLRNFEVLYRRRVERVGMGSSSDFLLQVAKVCRAQAQIAGTNAISKRRQSFSF